MKQRSRQDWQQLIKQQPDSNLSILNFCKQQNISASCFYKHKASNRIKPEPQASTFIKVEVPSQKTTKPEAIKLQHGKTRIHLPATVQPLWLADFVKALS